MAAAKPARHKQQQQQQQQQQQYPSPPELHAVEQPASLADAEPPTSRLCVKNIPKYLPEQRLKDHFSVKGQVTDIKILKTRDGQPRQMAFVGYRSVDDAAAALKYFNNTFIDTCRISIEYARRYRSYEPPAAADGQAAAAAAAAADAHRPWSKYSAGSSKHQQLVAKAAEAAAAAAAAPEDAAAADKAARKAKREAKKAKKAAGGVDEAAGADPKLAEFLELMQPRAKAKIWSNDEVLPAGQAGKAAAAAAAAAAGKAGAHAEEEPDDLYEDLPAAAAAARRANGAGAFEGASDSEDDNRSSQSGSEDDTDPVVVQDAVVVDEGVSDLDYLRARMRKAPAAAAAAAAAGGSSEDGEDSSSSIGESDDGFDEETEHAARRQRQHMVSTSDSSGSESDDSEGGGSDGDVMQQQQQRRRLAGGKQPKQQQGPDGDGSEPSGSSEDDDSEGGSEEEDEQQQQQQQQEAEDDDPMAVDVEQGAVHGQGSFPAAAAVVDGSEAAAAEGSIRESGRLFVRNLAYTAGQVELSELFGAYGDLEEVHLVLDRDTRRSKGIAYIKYLLPEDAVAAFRALDMTPFQGRLLHLLPAKRKPGEDLDDKADKEVARRKGPDGKLLSMGYGFVETDSEAAAKTAIKQLQGSMLDKHKLTLQLSKRSATGSGAAGSKAKKGSKEADGKGAKLVVRNVAFEATKKDIMGLFGPFGHLKSCRLPKKFDGNHRGFAFLEFTTKQEAGNALEGVGGTHLYGRRLVVEYAAADAEGLAAGGEPADMAAARAKTAAKFFGSGGRAGAGGEEGSAEADAPARKRMKGNL